jgi:Fe(3+) dicitrate transport protein
MPVCRLLCASSAVALLSGAAMAQPAATPTAASEEVTVIGTKPDLRRIAGAGTIVDEEALRRQRPLSVNEALRLVPGVFPRDEEGIGMRPNIGLRGLTPTRSTKVLLLEDGIPTTYAPYGDQASYYHPPIGRFARIEVLKGAAQVRFGPQSVAGVINYITPAAPETAMGRVTIAGGNRGYSEIDATAGGPALGGRFLLHANYKTSDGSRENQALRFLDLYLKGEWDLGPSHGLTVRINRFAEDSQVTYSGLTLAEYMANPRFNPFANDQFVTERWGASASHRWTLSEAAVLKTTLYYQSFDRDWWRQSSNSGQRPNDASDPACGGMANLDRTCGNEGRLRYYETWGIETRLSLAHDVFGAAASTELGLRYHNESQSRLQVNGDSPRARAPGTSVNGGTVENNLRDAAAVAVFAGSKIDFGRFAIEPGIRAEFISYDRFNRLNGARGTAKLEEFVPGIGFIFDVSDTISFYGGVHKGFAPPRVEDTISNTTGGAIDLDAEESWNYELGLRGTVTPGVFADVALFRLDFANQIVPASVAGGTGATLTSAGETLHQGVEALLDVSLKDAGVFERDDLYFRTAVTWLPVAEFKGRRFSAISGFGAVSVSGNRVPYAPEWLLSATLGYAFADRFSVQAELQYTGAMFTDDLNTVPVTANGQRGRIESATTVNLTANIDVPESGFGFYASVKNVFDETFIVDRSRGILPGPARQFVVGLSAAF